MSETPRGPGDPGTCFYEGCRAPILWAVTVLGRRMPLDPDPTPDGIVIELADGHVRVLDETERQHFKGTRWTAHWATCSGAPLARNRRQAEPKTKTPPQAESLFD